NGLVLVRISAPGTGTPPGPGAQPDAGRIDVRLAGDATPAGLRALVADPALTVLVRPDRVVADVGTRSRRPRLPWNIPPAPRPQGGDGRGSAPASPTGTQPTAPRRWRPPSSPISCP